MGYNPRSSVVVAELFLLEGDALVAAGFPEKPAFHSDHVREETAWYLARAAAQTGLAQVVAAASPIAGIEKSGLPGEQ